MEGFVIISMVVISWLIIYHLRGEERGESRHIIIF